MTQYRQELGVAEYILRRRNWNISWHRCLRLRVQEFAHGGDGEVRARHLFFNGGVEMPFAGEERILVPSPKVATYDLKPEMSAGGITDTAVKAIEQGEFDAIIMNYANADMVGHSGKTGSGDQSGWKQWTPGWHNLSSAEIARRSVDYHRGPRECGDDDRSGVRRTTHVSTPRILCRLFWLSDDDKLRLKAGGSLRDIAPTMLGALRQPQPAI